MNQPCSNCSEEMERGTVLASSFVGWSSRPSPLLPSDAFTFSRNSYSGQPSSYPGLRCPKCKVCMVAQYAAQFNTSDCRHAFENGWIFPRATIYWAQTEDFKPAFLFPMNLRGKDGTLAEALVSPGLAVSIQGTRCPAGKCTQCGALKVHYSKE